jgi:hypothetical protein
MLAHTQIFADRTKPETRFFDYPRKFRLFCVNLVRQAKPG